MYTLYSPGTQHAGNGGNVFFFLKLFLYLSLNKIGLLLGTSTRRSEKAATTEKCVCLPKQHIKMVALTSNADKLTILAELQSHKLRLSYSVLLGQPCLL